MKYIAFIFAIPFLLIGAGAFFIWENTVVGWEMGKELRNITIGGENA